VFFERRTRRAAMRQRFLPREGSLTVMSEDQGAKAILVADHPEPNHRKMGRSRHRPARVVPPKRGTIREPVDCEPTAETPRDELGRPTRRKTKRPSERRSPESTPVFDRIATSGLILEADVSRWW